MTIATLINRNDYTGDGIVVTFPFEFMITEKPDLTVYVAGVLQTLGIEYEINGTSWLTGGNVVFNVGYVPADNVTVALIRSIPLIQTTNYIEGDKFPANTHELALDRIVMMIQDLKNYLENAFEDIVVSSGPLFPILAVDPDTSGWGMDEAPTFWFNSADLKYKAWNGSEIVLLG